METLLCWKCVGDSVLRKWVQTHSQNGKCSFCGAKRRVCELAAVAEEIDRAIREFYEPSPETGHVVPDSDNVQYWADGVSGREIIQEIADVEEDVATAIDSVLADAESHDVQDGADAFYDDSPLRHVDAHPDEFMSIWQAFEHRLMHEQRFFDEQGKKMLDELFGDLTSLAGGNAIVTLDPATAPRLYRARIIRNFADTEEYIRDPVRHLGPPPPHLAPAGRMNPAGIPAFYGAFSKEVALAEIRPPVGARVAIGEFSILRSLQLLDMSFFPFAYHTESIFSPNYDRLRNKVAFLEDLHRRLSRPVLPSDEVLAYLPTQAAAAYFTNVLGLDGVIYSSNQIDADGNAIAGEQVERTLCNIALFSAAATVEPRQRIPPPAASEGGVTAAQGAQFEMVVIDPSLPMAAVSPLVSPAETNVLSVATPLATDHGPELGSPTSNYAPALRLEGSPSIVKISAVAVTPSSIVTHLDADGSVMIGMYFDDD